MKTKILYLLILPCIFLLINSAKSQAVLQPGNPPGNVFKVDTIMFPGIIQHQATSTPSADSQALRGQRVMWLEYGDGSFTTLQTSTHQMGISPNNYFLLTNRLYDTVRDVRMGSGQFGGNTTGRTNGDNDSKLINANATGIIITPNVYDIVRKDTMAFAVTYHISKSDYSSEANYYIVFLYRNNVFDSFVANRNVFNSIKSFRTSIGNGDQNIDSSSLTNAQLVFINNLKGTTYDKFAVIKLNNLNDFEHNVFLSLFTRSALQAGGSTNLKAILLRESSSSGTTSPPQTIATYETASMSFRASHDPNYITQFPLCMQLPKIARTFSYHIHFQNTGEGEADSVRVTAFLPSGMVLADISSVSVGNKNFATDLNTIFSIEKVDGSSNKVVFLLTRNTTNTSSTDLKGIAGLNDAMVNPVTMGDIYFDLHATDTVHNVMLARASIDFHSAQTHKWEQPVITNFATSYYSDCTDSVFCNCKIPGIDTIPNPPNPTPPHPTPDSCTKFLSLCWWWWVIIAIAGIIIYSVARKRKEK